MDHKLLGTYIKEEVLNETEEDLIQKIFSPEDLSNHETLYGSEIKLEMMKIEETRPRQPQGNSNEDPQIFGELKTMDENTYQELLTESRRRLQIALAKKEKLVVQQRDLINKTNTTVEQLNEVANDVTYFTNNIRAFEELIQNEALPQ